MPDTVICSVAGKLSDGASCAHTLKADTYQLTFEQFIAFLEATDKTGAAVCLSAEDYKKQKTALEKACRELGSKCKYRVSIQPLTQDQELPYGE